MKFLNETCKTERYKHCTQEQLSEKTDISLEVIRNIEMGRKKITPEHPEFKKMCACLKLDPHEFFAKDTKVITFLSNKGGSTKTTSCANLAYTLAADYNKKVLLIDTDLQQNLTQHYGIEANSEKNFYAAFVKGEDIQQHIRPTAYNNIDMVTGHDMLAVIETQIMQMDFKEYRVKEILEHVIEAHIYDYIMIDCNPSLNHLNTSILFATHGLIVPLNPTAFGKSGLDLIVNFYTNIEKRSKDLQLLGVLVNKYDQRKRVPRDVVQLVTEKFGEKKVLFKTMVPDDANVDKAQMIEEPLAVSYPTTRAAIAFKELADEVIKRGQRL